MGIVCLCYVTALRYLEVEENGVGSTDSLETPRGCADGGNGFNGVETKEGDVLKGNKLYANSHGSKFKQVDSDLE